jgi:hypothetical protein
MVVAEWDVTAMLLDGSELSGMMPTLFAENPAVAEVAFHADPGNGRRDVDRLNRSLFQAEVVDGEEAIQICRKPRAGKPCTSSSRRTSKLSRTRPDPACRPSRSHPDPVPLTSSQEPLPVLSLLVLVLNLRRKSPGLSPHLTKVRVYSLKENSSKNIVNFG